MRDFPAHYLPVAQRELREGARRPLVYWLRVVGAAAAVAVLWFSRDDVTAPSSAGLQIFTGVHQVLLGLICAVVPAMGADCLARERRDGTLGLLFLTPLHPFGVVLGKALVQVFRALTLWLAAAPVVVVPFLCGGVTWGDIASAIIIEFCVTLLCLTAGMVASSLVKGRAKAMVLAECLGVVLVAVFAVVIGLCYGAATVGRTRGLTSSDVVQLGRELIVGAPDNAAAAALALPGTFVTVSMPGGTTATFARVRSRPFRFSLQGLSSTTYHIVSSSPTRSRSGGSPLGWGRLSGAWTGMLVGSLLLLPLNCLWLLLLASRNVAKAWQDAVPSPRRDALVRRFCLPQEHDRFVWNSRKAMESNPVAWLQQYSWQARLSKWMLCLGFIGLEGILSMSGPEAMAQAQTFMFWTLAAAFTYAGVNGFLTEKKSGALELLLVSPVSPDAIIWGRAWGLWKQFLPAGITLLLLWLASQLFINMEQPPWGGWGAQAPPPTGGALWEFLTWPIHPNTLPMFLGETGEDVASGSIVRIGAIVTGFFALPVVATYFALRVKNLFVAAGLTWLVLLLCPMFAFMGVGLIPDLFYSFGAIGLCAAVAAANLCFGLLMFFLLGHSLSRRIYSF